MSYDLSRELTVLGAQERAAAEALPVDALRTRARRRRAMRTAAATGATLAFVAAIAVAAVALPGSVPVPPADSPNPTPTPTATAVPWPTAITLDGAVPGCGDPMPGVLSPEGEPELRLDVTLPPGPTRAGESIQAQVTLTGLTRASDVWMEGTAILVVQDGVVLGRERVDNTDGSQVHEADDGAKTLARTQAVDLVACETAGRGAVGLAAGEYAVYAVQELLRNAGDGGYRSISVVGGPYPLVIEAPFDPHPALEDLVISPSGLGPLTVGLPPETNPGAAMITFDEDYCLEQSDGWWDEAVQGPPGEWVAAGYPEVPAFWATGTETQAPFRVAARETVLRIDIISPLLRTSEGIGLGSTLTELLAAHPDVVEQTEMANWSRAWVIEGPEGTLVFETADDLDGYLPELTEETIVGIRIVAPGKYLPLQTLGSGNVVGNCGLS